MKSLSLILLLSLGLFSCSKYNEHILTSPDRNIEVTILNQDTASNFLLIYKGDTIIKKSALGLLVNGIDFTNKVSLSDYSASNYDDTWTSVNGKNPVVRNHYTEYIFKCSKIESEKDFYKIVFRLYNDGFAYRYQFPAESIRDSILINKELTNLNFYADFKYWAYNGEHHNIGPIQQSAKELENVRIPMVLQIDEDVFMAIHEAEIISFAPFSINATGKGNSLKINISYSSRDEAFNTSWRTFIIGENAGDLVESDLLVKLNEPCKIEDTSWIKPGKTMWDWRVWGYKTEDGYEYGLNTESHKRFIDFASENNIQYLLIDADWYGSEFSETSDPTSTGENINIVEDMRYAKEKGVGLILYLNDVGAKKFGLERVLKQFADWGAAGVKYGFMRGSEEKKVAHTRRVVELCAKYKLMVNFHDNPVPPSGEMRTWPNLVSKEFCHSQADAHRSYFPETAVNTALINMIAGPLDACNGWFDLNNSLYREKVFEVLPGTVVAELAKLIVIHTGWMVLPDSPEEYLKKSDLFDCIRKMPAQFDGFKVLDGIIDEFVCIARKAGDNWFIGSLTNRVARTIKIDLSFLLKDKKYVATIWEDAADSHFTDNKESYNIRKQIVDSSTELEIKMAAGGGNAIFLRDMGTEGMATGKSENNTYSFFVGTYTRDESQGIYKYSMDNDGSMKPGCLAAKSENPSFLALSADKKYLLAVNEISNKNGAGTVESYKISDDGLSFISRSSSGGAHPCYVTSNQGAYVLTANYSGGNIGLLKINNKGELSDLLDVQQHTGSGSTDRQQSPHAHSAWFDPLDNSIIAVDLGTNELWFSYLDIDKNKLIPSDPQNIKLAPGAGPRHLAFHPNNKWVYVVNELDCTVTLLKKNDTGIYKIVSSVSTLPPDYSETSYCADIHISSDGKFVYASNRGHHSIAIFEVNTDEGFLNLLGHQSTFGNWPRNFSLSPDDKYLLVANQKSGNIVSFSRNKDTGLLQYLHQIDAPAPVCILFLN